MVVSSSKTLWQSLMTGKFSGVFTQKGRHSSLCVAKQTKAIHPESHIRAHDVKSVQNYTPHFVCAPEMALRSYYETTKMLSEPTHGLLSSEVVDIKAHDFLPVFFSSTSSPSQE